MQNWSTDTVELQNDPEQYALWRLEHLVNFGLGGERIDREELQKYWSRMNLDPNKKSISLCFYGRNNLERESAKSFGNYESGVSPGFFLKKG